MSTWKHRRRDAGLHDAPLTPGQVQGLRRRDAVLMTWATRGFIASSIVAVVVVGATAATFDARTYMSLVVLGFATAAVFGIALAATWYGRVKAAGLLVWAVSVIAVIVLCFELSTGSQAHTLLFGLAVIPFILVSSKDTGLRVVMTLTAVAAMPLCVIAWPPGQGAHQLSALATQELSEFNAAGAAFLAGGALVVLQLRLRFKLGILEGAARYGELRATTDELTGVYNRRPVLAQLEQYAERGRSNYAIALIDLDKFKSINDAFGHECGDVMIRLVAETLTAYFRATDMVSRWGGDEFLVLMPGIRHAELAPVLDRLRADIAALRIYCEGHNHHVTVSIGAAMGQRDQTPELCIAAADHALYKAKDNGRNDVVTVGSSLPAAAPRRR